MNRRWQFFGNMDEAAGLALLVALGGVVAFVAVLVRWLTLGRYVAALGLVVTMGAALGVCSRDYRRGRWSVLSGVLVLIWLLVTGAALVSGDWLSRGQG